MSEFLLAFASLLLATVRISTPLIFASLGGVCSERSGVINIALEGKMMWGAFVAATVTYFTLNPWLGFFMGGVAGMMVAFVYAIFVLGFSSNQIITGLAINVIAAGFLPILSNYIFSNSGSTPHLSLENTLYFFPLIFVWLCVFVLWFAMKRTAFGLWTEAAGEHPEALHAARISFIKVRFFNILLAGFLAGLGGATLSICISSGYSNNMTALRGFIAISAVIIGNWKPLNSALACLMFGFFDALAFRIQGESVGGIELPVQLVQVLPYAMTLVTLIFFKEFSSKPKALGLPVKIEIKA